MVHVGTCYWYKLFIGYWYRLITSCLVQVVWCRLIGTGCYKLLVQVDSDRLTMIVFDSVTVIGCLHLEFIFQRGWRGQG